MTGFLERRYGHGAARLLIPAEPSPTHVSLGRARDVQDLLISLAIGALLMLGISNALRRADDDLETRIVLLEPTPPEAAPPPEPEPEPVVEVARVPEPPPPPPPTAPPPPKVPAIPKPPPPVVRPPPPPPEITRPAPPQPKRPAPPPPLQRTPQRIEVAALAQPEPAGEPPPPPSRNAPDLPRPRLSTPAPRPIAVAALEAPAPAAPERAFEESRRALPRPSAPRTQSTRPSPVVAALPSPAPTLSSESSRVSSARVTRAPAPTPADTRAARAASPGVAMPSFSTRQSAAAAPARNARAAAPAPAPSAPATQRSAAPEIRGVPLGSLAACRSDRDEETLKRRVLAAVTKPGECTSAAGRYRLVETKNLNAFLMWIERAPHRPEADRCAELAFALECLERSSRRGSSR